MCLQSSRVSTCTCKWIWIARPCPYIICRLCSFHLLCSSFIWMFQARSWSIFAGDPTILFSKGKTRDLERRQSLSYPGGRGISPPPPAAKFIFKYKGYAFRAANFYMFQLCKHPHQLISVVCVICLKLERQFNPLRANYCHTWHMEHHPFFMKANPSYTTDSSMYGP